MSQDNNAGAPQALDPDTAYAVVHQRVYSPVFFEKLARDYNIRPRNQPEAMEMLTMAAQLRMAHDTEQEKQAAAGNSLLAGAHSHLNNLMAQHGYNVPQVNINDSLVKEAAAQASFDPELARAVLSLQAHSAAQEAADQAA